MSWFGQREWSTADFLFAAFKTNHWADITPMSLTVMSSRPNSYHKILSPIFPLRQMLVLDRERDKILDETAVIDRWRDKHVIVCNKDATCEDRGSIPVLIFSGRQPSLKSYSQWERKRQANKQTSIRQTGKRAQWLEKLARTRRFDVPSVQYHVRLLRKTYTFSATIWRAKKKDWITGSWLYRE